ncbi:MAG: SIR2 family protein [bacterium]|nr:SIR2 family protein [bacterium]
MEYLKQQFEEELDAEGEVSIRGNIYSRTEILSGVRPEAYDLALDEWIGERNQRLIVEANEYLEEFDAVDRFERLKTSYSTSEMLPFVGAGMSIETGYPAWTPTLFKLQRMSTIAEDDLTAMLKRGDYEEAAQRLHDDLGAALFNERLEGIFANNLSPTGVINFLPELFPRGTVLTTNFDRLLEEVFKELSQGFDEVETGRDLAEVLRQHAGGGRLLVKIHGHCTKLNARVLLSDEYETAYSDEGVVSQFFNRIMFGRAMLFLGCSLYVDRTLAAMEAVVEMHGQENLPRHYAFLELKEGENQGKRERQLAKANIFPIWYPKDQHGAVEAFLVKLKTETDD